MLIATCDGPSCVRPSPSSLLWASMSHLARLYREIHWSHCMSRDWTKKHPTPTSWVTEKRWYSSSWCSLLIHVLNVWYHLLIYSHFPRARPRQPEIICPLPREAPLTLVHCMTSQYAYLISKHRGPDASSHQIWSYWSNKNNSWIGMRTAQCSATMARSTLPLKDVISIVP